MPNRLIHENSPYLLQHSQNPVDWYPWGTEALEKARQEDKPIFLSIGYAACHWCHVMAHESFENPATADFMNLNYVNIKVDREERPDLDTLYMNAVVAITGQGGWPMSVFLTPNGEPFFGGTYFPPTRRYNMPGFLEVLVSVAEAWKKERKQIEESSQNLVNHIYQIFSSTLQESKTGLIPEILNQAASSLFESFDHQNGGWGKAPKFPQPMAIDFLLSRVMNGDMNARKMAVFTLKMMARGGMYDVVGGGFSRYSTDGQWLIPHFEKMLYDNALLARVYLHAYLITKEPEFKKICTEILDFVIRDLTDVSGGFYSSLDADSEGEEGKYYLWSLEEISKILAPTGKTTFFLSAYGVKTTGNFEGHTVLQRVKDDSELSSLFSLSSTQVQQSIDECHKLLLEKRSKRVKPATDDKVLVSWNALMLMAFAEAGRFLKRPDYLEIARRNAEFLLNKLSFQDENLRVFRSWRNGKSQHPGFLEDYAGLALGLLALYQSDLNSSWYIQAKELCQTIAIHFQDPNGGFFDSSDDSESLIVRPKDTQDNATPSGGAMACLAFLQMAALSGNGKWREIAESALTQQQENLGRYPTSFSFWLSALSFAIGPVAEIAILGKLGEQETELLLETVQANYHPNSVLAASSYPPQPGFPELLQDRFLIDGKASAYVCQNFTCKQPVTSPEALEFQLRTIYHFNVK